MTDFDHAPLKPFHLCVPDQELAALKRKIADTRWPEKETVADWSQGVPLSFMRQACEYWAKDYDWRRCEAQLNGLGQFMTEIDGLDIHFLHVRSPHAGARPLIMTHGWPSSVVEFLKVIAPLTDPCAHGGHADDAFHLVIPSLPGYGFSGKPAATGWTVPKIASAWSILMRRLGYDSFLAQGGDWGSFIATEMGAQKVPGCTALHLSMPVAYPAGDDMTDLTPVEQASVRSLQDHMEQGTGYSKIQATRPQTIAYGLTDSPAGLAAWIIDKLWTWSDCDGDLLSVMSFDDIFDNIMLYWLSASAGSAARLYWESAGKSNDLTKSQLAPVDIPVGGSVFPKDIIRPSRRWAERRYRQIIYWNELDRGGHFPALEQPKLFIEEVRRGFRPLR